MPPNPGYMGHMQRIARSHRVTTERGMFRGALDRMTGKEPQKAPDNDISAVLQRLNDTPDGQLFLQWFYEQTIGQQGSPDDTEGALRARDALKTFAAKIFNLLDRGLTRNAGPR